MKNQYPRLTARVFGVLQFFDKNQGTVTFRQAFKLDQRFLHAAFVRGFIGIDRDKSVLWLSSDGELARLSYLRADLSRRDITRPLAKVFRNRNKRVIPFAKTA